MNKCCNVSKKRIINKGSSVVINVQGMYLTEGESYTAVLYNDVRNVKCRATAQTIAFKQDNTIVCSFTFTSEETSNLKVGDCTFEFYNDENKKTFAYIEDFAEVRATALGY